MNIEEKMKEIISKLSPEDFCEIAWATFYRVREARSALEKLNCKECWKNNKSPHEKRSFDEVKGLYQKRLDDAIRVEKLFHECHSWDEEYIAKHTNEANRVADNIELGKELFEVKKNG